jgi:WD40 repeat protein
MDPLRAIVRVLAPSGETAGTGFLAGPAPWVITCAHVLLKADPRQTGSVQVELSGTGRRLTCNIVPDLSRDAKREDVAALSILGPPEEISVLPRVALGSSFRAIGPLLRSYGFHPVRGGTHATCKAIGSVDEGGFEALQLQTGEITYGFSGAPVWEQGSGFVVGMAMSIVPPELDLGGRLRETAYLRPIEVIREVCNLELEPGEPYRGLDVFDESNSASFFGRDRFIRDLIDKLEAFETVLVTGVSGSGKSSLLRAGLEKGLREYNPPAISGRRRVLITPTLTPVTTLVDALRPALPGLENNLTMTKTAGAKSGDAVDLESQIDVAALASSLRAAASAQPLIVIIDQFERLFTNCPIAVLRQRFMDLVQASSCGEIRYVVGLRLDFLEAVREHPYFGGLKDVRIVFLAQMSEVELKEVIEKPAAQLGRYVEPRAVQALVDDVKDRSGDLPLLQFALSELWAADNRRGVLSYVSYLALGYETPAQRITGAQGAIIKRAEHEWSRLQVSSGAPPQDPSDFLRLFLRLVQVLPANAGPALSASRRAWLAEFDPASREKAEKLSNSFLLTAGSDPVSRQPTIEVAHEALIRNWQKLSLSIEQNREFVIWYSNDLGFQLQNWLRTRKHYLSGDSLAAAARMYGEKPTLLQGPPAEFIRASQARRLWKRAGVAALCCCLVALAVYLSLQRAQTKKLQQQTKVATAEGLLESGVRALAERDFESAEILLAHSLQEHDSDDTRQHLLDARVNGTPLIRQRAFAGDSLGLSNSGAWAVVNLAGSIHLRNTSTGQDRVTPLRHNDDQRYAISDDGSLLLYGDRKGTLSALLGPESNLQWSKGDEPNGVDSIAISPDRARIAVGRLNGLVELRDARTGKLIDSVLRHRLAVHCVRFDRQGHWIASGGADRTVLLWSGKGDVFPLGSHSDFVVSLAFNGDGTQLASGGADGYVRVWDTVRRTALGSFTGHLGTVLSVAMSRSGLVLSGSDDKTLRLWDVGSGTEVERISVDGTVTGVFADDARNRAIAISCAGEPDSSKVCNGAIREWDLSRRDEGFTIYDTEPVTTVAVSPDGSRIAAGGEDGTITIWSSDGDRQGAPLQINSKSAPAIWSVIFTRDGKWLLSGGEDLAVRRWNLETRAVDEFRFGTDIVAAHLAGNVWTITQHPRKPLIAFGVAALNLSRIYFLDLNTWKEVGQIVRYGPKDTDKDEINGSVYSLSFHPSRELLAVGTGDQHLELWDVSDPSKATLRKRVKVGEELWGVPFSPDGTTLATAGLDRHVRLWNIPELAEVAPDQRFPRNFDHLGLIQSAAYSSDGSWIATASVDHTVKLWNLGGKRVIPVGGHDAPAWWVVFSRSGDTFISGGLDRRVIVRHMEKIQQLFNARATDLLEDARRHTCQDIHTGPNGKHLVYISCTP